MEKLKNTLSRLGWPVEDLSDGEIVSELHRRWFGKPVPTNQGGPLGFATAMGIVSALAKEGNLDALCWASSSAQVTEPEAVCEDLPSFDRHESGPGQPGYERRRSPRQRAKDFVTWSCDEDVETEATGWLICRAAEGIAFIAETGIVPKPESTIHVRVHSRFGGILELGKASVVRLEMLNEALSLVCVELERPIWSLSEEATPAPLPEAD